MVIILTFVERNRVRQKKLFTHNIVFIKLRSFVINPSAQPIKITKKNENTLKKNRTLGDKLLELNNMHRFQVKHANISLQQYYAMTAQSMHSKSKAELRYRVIQKKTFE